MVEDSFVHGLVVMVCARAGAPAAAWPMSQADKDRISRAAHQFGPNPCWIASMLRTCTCAQVHKW